MFRTLKSQYLNKLPEGKIGDFASPKPFHAVKIQSFCHYDIKPSAQVRGEFPMPIFALVGNMPIQPCEVADSTPPIVRTFDFTRKTFVEFSEFLQGLFQKLWRLYLLTHVQRQKCVFHAKVRPNAFTCCRQHFKGGRMRCDTQPIVTTGITLDSDISYIARPFTVFEKGKWHAIKLPLTRLRIPFTESQRDTIVFEFPASDTWVGNRFELMPLFDLRSTTYLIKKR